MDCQEIGGVLGGIGLIRHLERPCSRVYVLLDGWHGRILLLCAFDANKVVNSQTKHAQNDDCGVKTILADGPNDKNFEAFQVKGEEQS